MSRQCQNVTNVSKRHLDKLQTVHGPASPWTPLWAELTQAKRRETCSLSDRPGAEHGGFLPSEQTPDEAISFDSLGN